MNPNQRYSFSSSSTAASGQQQQHHHTSLNSSTISLPTPTAEQQSSDSAINTTLSLYHRCVHLAATLYSIPHFDFYLFPTIQALQYHQGANGSSPSAAKSIASVISPDSRTLLDPMALLWSCFRLGVPLCYLANLLLSKPSTSSRRGTFLSARPELLEVPGDDVVLSILPTPASNMSKKCVYHFILFLKDHLSFADEDMFTISELYKEETHGFIKVLGTIEKVIAVMKDRRILPPIRDNLPFRYQFDDPQESHSGSGASAHRISVGGDNRSKLMHELVETERKYHAQLEELQGYQNELISIGIERDLIFHIFANLDELIDFERRFLISMEAMAATSLNEQRVGSLFITNESAFGVYEVFCANHQKSTEAIASHSSALSRAHKMDARSLSSYLIKPIQRICRYPLFLKEFIKYCPADYPYKKELEDGFACIKRVGDVINEANRRAENLQLKHELKDRVEDWKGMDIDDFGDLVLSEKFSIISGDLEREYLVFLFETILICCKDVPKKRRTWLKSNVPETPSYVLKGNIYITSITGATEVVSAEQNQFYLKIFWRDNTDLVSFTLKCRSTDQISLWKDRLESLIDAFWKKRRVATNALLQSTGGVSSSSTKSNHRKSQLMELQAFTLGSNSPTSTSQTGSNPNLDAPRLSSLRYTMQSMALSDVSQSADTSTTLSDHRRSQIGNSVLPTATTSSKSSGNSTISADSASGGKLSTISTVPGVRPIVAPQTSLPIPGYQPPLLEPDVRNVARSSLPVMPRQPPSSSLDPLISPMSIYGESPPLPILDYNARMSIATNSSTGSLRATMSPPPKMDLPPPPPPSTSTSDLKRLSSVPQRPSQPSVSSTNTIKVKAHYAEEIFSFSLATGQVSFAELYTQIAQKMQLMGMSEPASAKWRLKYVDEEGDAIAILSDHDVEEAIETSKGTGSLHIFIR